MAMVDVQIVKSTCMVGYCDGCMRTDHVAFYLTKCISYIFYVVLRKRKPQFVNTHCAM